MAPSTHKNTNVEARDFISVLKKLIHYLGAYKYGVLVAVVFALVATLLLIFGPTYMKELTDIITLGLPQVVGGERVSEPIDFTSIRHIAYKTTAIYLLSGAFSLVKSWLMATISQRTTQKMRSDINEKVNRLPFSYFNGHTHGDIISRLANDVDSIGQAMNQSFVGILTSTTQFIGVLLMMFYNSLPLTLTALVSTAFGMYMMLFIMSRSQRHFRTQQATLGDLNGYIEEMFTGQTIMRSYNAVPQAKETFARYNERYAENAWKSQFLSGLMMPLMQFVGNLGYVLVSIVGAVLVLRGSLSFGTIVAFMIYVRLFTEPLTQMAQAMNQLQMAVASGDRVFTLLEAEEVAAEEDKIQGLEAVEGHVIFEDVSFGYEKDKEVIHNFTADIQAGQKVAIVGPTGAGKTTIVNLLMRFYEVDNGAILLDGIDIRKVTREALRSQFSMILQDTWLFDGSIKDNMVFNSPPISDDELQEIGRLVGLDHFIRTLPDGYETQLDDKTQLSQGQKQLLTIARAMIHNAPMLILDEATSSVDTRMERLVQEAMDHAMQGRTSFVIAHRLSTIRNADLILVMKEGELIEAGTHEALLEQEGAYAALYRSQFEENL